MTPCVRGRVAAGDRLTWMSDPVPRRTTACVCHGVLCASAGGDAMNPAFRTPPPSRYCGRPRARPARNCGTSSSTRGGVTRPPRSAFRSAGCADTCGRARRGSTGTTYCTGTRASRTRPPTCHDHACVWRWPEPGHPFRPVGVGDCGAAGHRLPQSKEAWTAPDVEQAPHPVPRASRVEGAEPLELRTV